MEKVLANHVKYRPEIDGLRTLAVIPVILFHLGYTWIKGGYYGVDVFFVISGYLITKILAEQIPSHRFSMSNFWLRRVRRLLPALLTVVFVTLIFSYLFLFKNFTKEMAADAIPALFSYTNFHAFYNFGNYWGAKAENSFFLHTWSLAVEEQFYLVYPLVLVLCYRWFKNFKWPLLAIAVISFAVFYYTLIHNPTFAFYMLPARSWELAVGGLTALVPAKRPSSAASAAGLILILLSYFWDKGSLGLHVVLPVVGTALLLRYSSAVLLPGKMLANPIMVHIGKLSYSMYLWHWPLIIFVKKMSYQLRDANEHWINFCVLAVTFLLTSLTYYWVENKTRNHPKTPRFVMEGAFVLLACSLYLSKFYPTDYSHDFNQQTAYFKYFDISPHQTPASDNLLFKNAIVPARPASFKDAYKKDGLINRMDSENPKMLLIGDSHSVMWAKTITEIAQSQRLPYSFYTIDGDKPFISWDSDKAIDKTLMFSKTERTAYEQALKANLEKWPLKLIIIACRWDNYPDPHLTKVKQLLQFAADRHIKVLMLTQPPKIPYFSDQDPQQYFSYLNLKPDAQNEILLDNDKSLQPVLDGNANLKRETAAFKTIAYFDAYAPFIKGGRILVAKNNSCFYFDDDHLSYFGTQYLKPQLAETIKALQTNH